MEFAYKFLNRENELNELRNSFKKIIPGKSKDGFVIQGRMGMGKTKLVDEFLNVISKEVVFYKIPEFNKIDHVIECSCNEENISPYEPFIKIKESIDRHNKFLRILTKSFQAIMAIFGINDLYNALADLRQSIVEEKNTVLIRKKEAKIFNSYLKFIERKSRKNPLVIFIKNAQWIDEHSLRLIRDLLISDKSLWGIIILEIDDIEQDNETNNVHTLINELVAEKVISRMVLIPLDNNFPIKLLEDRFGEDFLTVEENDILFTVSQGTPGILISLVEKSIDEKWIYKEGNKWRKKDNFKELIKPKFQQLIELICTTYSDHILTDRELQLIQNMAAGWDISPKLLDDTVSMVKCIMDQGFNIVQNIGPGILSNYSFLVSDSKSQRYIVEYLPSILNPKDSLIKQRDFKQGNLLEAKEIRIAENGILIIWKYIDAIRTRNLLMISNEVHLHKVVEKIRQVTRAVVELHRQSVVHGFIKPESIFKAKNDHYFLATFDIALIHFLPQSVIRKNRYYLSPEQLEGKEPDFRSDVYSLGVLFYESLTEHLPFNGETDKNLLENINQNIVEFDGTLVSMVPAEIQDIIKKCLQINPDLRYKDAEEFYQDLKEIRPGDIYDYSGNISSIRNFIKEKKWEDAKNQLPKIHDPSIRKRMENEVISSEKTNKKKPKFNYKYLALVTIILIGIAIYKFLKPEIKIVFVPYTAVQITQEDINQSNRPVRARMLEYLLVDDLTQNSNEKVLSISDFDKLFNDTDSEDFQPEMLISGVIKNRQLDYEFRINIADSLKTVSVLTYTPNDPSDFLTDIISKVTNAFFNYKKIAKVRIPTFTNDWDAFRNFYRGERYSLRLERDLAIEYYQTAVSIDKNFVLAKLRLASILRGNDNLKANKILNEIWLRIGELSRADSLKAVALKLRLKGNLRDAIKAYKQIIKFKPADKDSYFDVAEAYFDLRDIRQARRYYLEALKIDKDFSLAINHLAYCYSTLGKHSEAIELFKRYVELDSTANSYDSMGDGYAAAGKTDSAVWAKKKGIELDPGLEYLQSSLTYINFRAGRINEANKCLQNYFKIINSRPDTNFQQYSTYYFLSALLNYAKDSLQLALTNCLKAKSIFDSENLANRNNGLHWLLAILYFEQEDQNNFTKEINKMDGIITVNNINETDYNEMLKFRLHLEALLAAKKGDTEKLHSIVNIFDGPIEWKVKDHTSVFDLAFFNNCFGELYLQLNQLNGAKERFDKAIKYNPNYAMAHYNLSKLYEKLGNKIRADNERKNFDKLWSKSDIKPSHFVTINHNISLSSANN